MAGYTWKVKMPLADGNPSSRGHFRSVRTTINLSRMRSVLLVASQHQIVLKEICKNKNENPTELETCGIQGRQTVALSHIT